MLDSKGIVDLTQFGGHLMIKQGGVHNAERKETVSSRIPKEYS